MRQSMAKLMRWIDENAGDVVAVLAILEMVYATVGVFAHRPDVTLVGYANAIILMILVLPRRIRQELEVARQKTAIDHLRGTVGHFLWEASTAPIDKQKPLS